MTHLETLAVVLPLKQFKDTILVCPIIIYTDHAAIDELFEGKNLSGKIAHCYCNINEFVPTFKYLLYRTNIAADAISRKVPVGTITSPASVSDFTLRALGIAQGKHDVYQKL